MNNCKANHCIECSVTQCANHCQSENYCALERIRVGTHEANPVSYTHLFCPFVMHFVKSGLEMGRFLYYNRVEKNKMP